MEKRRMPFPEEVSDRISHGQPGDDPTDPAQRAINTKMRFATPDMMRQFQPKPKGEEVVVNPMVQAFAAIGAKLGNQMGMLALRSIEAHRGGIGAVLLWVK